MCAGDEPVDDEADPPEPGKRQSRRLATDDDTADARADRESAMTERSRRVDDVQSHADEDECFNRCDLQIRRRKHRRKYTHNPLQYRRNTSISNRALVRDWVRSCAICQRNKTQDLHPAGLLQPLDVPSQVWADISLDFIEGLPKVHGKLVILTVVDRFSMYVHFITLSHPYTAASMARALFDGVVRLHGFPSSIVSDRDPVFTGHIWRDLFKMAGVQLRMSTVFHPQTGRQSEVVNKTIAMYLHCITGDRPRAWVDWLPWAEYCYNTSYHSALHTMPFKVVYCREPPALVPFQQGTTSTQSVDDMLSERDLFLREVRERLLQAQEHARRYYDAHHRDLEFAVGDWVWLRLLHRQALSPIDRPKGKLGTRYAGPFKVLE
ncbi:hypothetical protein U9M48_039677 [Paspalum notatum var. saurae]|uniref:Integrase catalytic domain-containing protein n=1 Tax=Paspalum notatum var. saurae TaxID=547442 RepID=A0AAQ3UK26_PASNO